MASIPTVKFVSADLKANAVLSLTIATLVCAQPQVAWAATAKTTDEKEPSKQVVDETTSPRATAVTKQTNTAKNTETAKEDPVELEEMVVSATKTETLVSNAPAAVSVVSQKDFDARNVSRLGDALSKVPGLYLGFPAMGSTQGSSGSGGFSLRGGNTQRTLVLVDGQPLQDGNSSNIDWRTVMTDDMERIEVVPGAFSSLYGSSAIGGVINVLTKRPDKHELTIRAKKGFQEVEGEDASIYWREQLGYGFGVTAGFSYQDRDGYPNEYNIRTVSPITSSQLTTSTPVTGAIPTTTVQGVPAYIVGAKGQSKWTQMNATGKLEWKPNDNNRLFVGYAFSNYDMGYTPLTPYLRDAAGNPIVSGNVNINGGLAALSQSQFVTSAPLNSDSNRYFGGFEHYFNDEVVLKANIAYIKRAYSFSTGATSVTQFNGPGSLTDAPNDGLDSNLQLNFPLHFKGLPFAKEHMFVTGGNFHRETVDRYAYALSNWRDIDSKTSVQTNYTGDTSIYSLYAQDEITVFDPWTVYLGGRVNWWETQGSFNQYTAPLTNLTFNQRSQVNFSPKVSTVYHPIDDVTLRASWGQSFRAPANADLYSTSVIFSSNSPTGYLTTQGSPTLVPETATSWEVGGEWRITPKMTVGATYYETEINNMIYSRNTTLALTEKVNAGKARIRGVELAFGAKPLDWMELYSNFSYTDSIILANSADSSSVGKQLTTIPKYTAKGGIIANYQSWSGTLEANYFSHVYVQSNNSDVMDNVPGASSEYAVVNAKLGYRVNDHIKINAAINNLTNEKYYQFYLMPGINLTTELVLSF